MKKIVLNTVNKSQNYIKNIELLFSDYELIRKKHFSLLCIDLLKQSFTNSDLLLTHSATGALEIIATLLNLKPGDEVIMPSFSFVSTAISFVNKGATPVFIDINPNTFNIDETLIEQAITPNTKAVIAMHYGGNSCNLRAISALCKKYNLVLIEDAAMGFGNNYKGSPLGSFGDLSVISFDVTKHIQAIQGGVLIINKKKYSPRANNIYNIGTNRTDFENQVVPYYEWVDYGSKYQMNELNAAVLYEQLKTAPDLFAHRKKISKLYYEKLKTLEEKKFLKLFSKEILAQNIHSFYLILNTEKERDLLKNHLNKNNIEALFHYNALHKSKMGITKGKSIAGTITEEVTKTILRLPFHSEIHETEIELITNCIFDFFKT